MPEKIEVIHKLLVRLPDNVYKALKRYSMDTGWSMTKILQTLLTKAIPEKYFKDPYKE